MTKLPPGTTRSRFISYEELRSLCAYACKATAAAESAEIYRLPEECVSYAISLTTPGDACHLSAVSPAFRAAADSDAVWARFLPPDHARVLARADEPVAVAGAASKELFSRLCDSPVVLDGATMSFGLERRSGAKYDCTCRIFILKCKDRSFSSPSVVADESEKRQFNAHGETPQFAWRNATSATKPGCMKLKS